MLTRVLSLCGGFLMAVLWFDLMFDVQVLRYHDTSAPLPEAVLTSIAGYYRRVTTDAFPMNRAISGIMLIAVGGSIWQVRRSRRRAVAIVALLLVVSPVGLAGARVFPDAVRLGSRADSLERQSELARSICLGHMACLAAMALFTSLQLSGVLDAPRRHGRGRS